jgi:hypothetical protein
MRIIDVFEVREVGALVIESGSLETLRAYGGLTCIESCYENGGNVGT